MAKNENLYVDSDIPSKIAELTPDTNVSEIVQADDNKNTTPELNKSKDTTKTEASPKIQTHKPNTLLAANKIQPNTAKNPTVDEKRPQVPNITKKTLQNYTNGTTLGTKDNIHTTQSEKLLIPQTNTLQQNEEKQNRTTANTQHKRTGLLSNTQLQESTTKTLTDAPAFTIKELEREEKAKETKKLNALTSKNINKQEINRITPNDTIKIASVDNTTKELQTNRLLNPEKTKISNPALKTLTDVKNFSTILDNNNKTGEPINQIQSKTINHNLAEEKTILNKNNTLKSNPKLNIPKKIDNKSNPDNTKINATPAQNLNTIPKTTTLTKITPAKIQSPKTISTEIPKSQPKTINSTPEPITTIKHSENSNSNIITKQQTNNETQAESQNNNDNQDATSTQPAPIVHNSEIHSITNNTNNLKSEPYNITKDKEDEKSFELEIDIVLDQMMLNGIGEAKLEKSEFSNPEVVIKEIKSDVIHDNLDDNIKYQHIQDIYLEKNEDLTPDLRKIINDYDDEIAHYNNKNEHACEIHLAIARLLEHANKEKLAYVRYLCAYERNPRSITAIRELRRIARAYNRMDDVIALVNAEIEAGVSPERRAELYEEYARLVRFVPGNDAQKEMIKGLKGVLANNPTNLSALDMLYTRLFQLKNWQNALEVLAKLANTVTDTSFKTGYFIEMAEIAENCLQDIGLATSCYLRAQEESPDSYYILQHLISLLVLQNRFQEIDPTIKKYISHCDSKQLFHALQLHRAVILADACGDVEGGIRCLEDLRTNFPNDRQLLETLAEFYERNRAHWEDLDKAYEKRILDSIDRKERISLALARVDNLIYNNAEKNRILDVLKQAHNDMPGDKHIQNRLRHAYLQLDNFDEAANLAWNLAEQAPPLEAADKFATLGTQYFEKRRDEIAEKCFLRALSLNPKHRIAFTCAETLLRKKNKFSELICLYQANLNATKSQKTRASLLRTMAIIYDRDLNNTDLAIQAMIAYREIFPDDLDAILTLQKFYTNKGNWLAVIEMLNAECSITDDHETKSDILLHIADICKNKLGRDYKAVEFLRMAIDENNYNIAAYARLTDILRNNYDWAHLLEVSRQLYPLLDEEEKLSTVCEMADIYESQIGNDELAIEKYKEALELDPTSSIAFSGLERIYKRTQNWQAYCDIIIWRSNQNLPKEQVVSMQYRVAKMMLLRFKRLHEAQLLLENTLQLDPNNHPVYDLLAHVYILTNQWDAAARLYQAKITSDEDPQTRGAYAFSFANLMFWKLGKIQDAINPLELSLALVPSMPAARNLLLRSLAMLGKFHELPPIFQEHSLCCNDDKLAITYCLNAADFVHYNRNEIPDEAAHTDEVLALQRILKIDPNNAIAIERLEAMETVRTKLAPFWEKRLLQTQGDENTELKLSLVEANFYQNPHDAFELLCDIVKNSPQHLPAIRMAANTALKLNNYMLASRFRTAEAECLENTNAKLNAWLDAANIAKEFLNRPDIVIHNLKQAFLINPKRADICDALIELLEKQQNWEEMNNLLSLQLNVANDDNKVDRLSQMVDIYLNQLKNPQQAIVKLKELLNIVPNDTQAIERMVDIELSLEHWSEAKNGLYKLLDNKKLPKSQKHHYRILLASILYEKLYNPEDAEKILLDELNDNNNDIESLKMLAIIYSKTGKYQESIHIHNSILSLVDEHEKPYLLLELVKNYRVIKNSEILHKTLLDLATYVTKDINVLNLIRENCTDFNELALILDYFKTLLDDNNIDINCKIKLYTFLVQAYRGPMHMRFEADKYALAAVQRAPKSLEARLLAADVFDPREAFIHINEAIAMDPFNVDAYHAMKRVAEATSKIDLLARIEVLLSNVTPDYPLTMLGKAVLNHTPDGFRTLSNEHLARFVHEDLDLWTAELFRIAGGKSQIFDLPPINSTPIAPNSSFAKLATPIAQTLGLENIELRYSDSNQFLYTYRNDDPNIPIFSTVILDEASTAEKKFHIACALSRIRLGTSIYKILDTNYLLRLLNGCVGLVYEQFGEPDIVKSLNSILPKKNKRAVIDFVSSTDFSKTKPNPNLLLAAATATEYRFGLIFSSDIGAALTALLRKQSAALRILTNPSQRFAQVQRARWAADLVAFYIGEKYTEARQLLGLQLINEENSL